MAPGQRGRVTASVTARTRRPPLAWSHAEYIKLLRSLADGRVWDHYDIVADRFSKP